MSCKNNKHCQKVTLNHSFIQSFIDSTGGMVNACINNIVKEKEMGKVKELSAEKFSRNLDKLAFENLSDEQEKRLMDEIFADMDKELKQKKLEDHVKSYTEGYNFGVKQTTKELYRHFMLTAAVYIGIQVIIFSLFFI